MEMEKKVERGPPSGDGVSIMNNNVSDISDLRDANTRPLSKILLTINTWIWSRKQLNCFKINRGELFAKGGSLEERYWGRLWTPKLTWNESAVVTPRE